MKKDLDWSCFLSELLRSAFFSSGRVREDRTLSVVRV